VRLLSINPLSASENPFCTWIVQLDKKKIKKLDSNEKTIVKSFSLNKQKGIRQ